MFFFPSRLFFFLFRSVRPVLWSYNAFAAVVVAGAVGPSVAYVFVAIHRSSSEIPLKSKFCLLQRAVSNVPSFMKDTQGPTMRDHSPHRNLCGAIYKHLSGTRLALLKALL